MELLPRDVIEQIAMELDTLEVVALGLTCMPLSLLILGEDSEPFWKRRCIEGAVNIINDEPSWKLMVIRRHSPLSASLWDKKQEKQPGALAKLVGMFKRVSTHRVLLCGLEGSGKTALCTKWHQCAGDGESLSSCVDMKLSGCRLLIRDVGYHDRVLVTSNQIINEIVDAVIFVCDSMPSMRSNDSRAAFRIIAEKTTDEQENRLPILILANKIDMAEAMSLAEITDILNLHAMRPREWYIQAVSAHTGDGILEGLFWLTGVLKNRVKKK